MSGHDVIFRGQHEKMVEDEDETGGAGDSLEKMMRMRVMMI